MTLRRTDNPQTRQNLPETKAGDRYRIDKATAGLLHFLQFGRRRRDGLCWRRVGRRRGLAALYRTRRNTKVGRQVEVLEKDEE